MGYGVRIPIIEQSTGVSVSQPTPQLSAVGVDNTLGKSLGELGQGIAHAYNAYEHQEAVKKAVAEQDGRADAVNRVPDFDLKAHQLFNQHQQQASIDGSGFYDNFTKDLHQLGNDFLQNAPENAKPFVQQHLSSSIARLSAQAVDYQAHTHENWRLDQTTQGIDKDAQNIENGTVSFSQARQRLNEAMPDLLPANRIKLLGQGVQQYARSAVSRQVLQDPAATLVQINQFLNLESVSRGDNPINPQVSGSASILGNALLGQESDYGRNPNTNKINDQNVTGPMQMQKATFEGLQRNGTIPADWEWTNPDHNTRAGFAHAHDLLNKYNGSYQKAAAAYYAGEKAVDENGNIRRDMRNTKHPEQPSVGEYVDQVMGRISGIRPVNSQDSPAPVKQDPELMQALSAMPVSDVLHYKNQAEQQSQRVDQGLQTSLNIYSQNVKAQAQNGIQPTEAPQPLSAYLSAFKDPQIAELKHKEDTAAYETGVTVSNLKTKSSAELSQIAGNELPAGSDAVAIHNANIQQKAAAQLVQMRSKDPWGYAMANQEFKAQPLDFNHLPESLKSRVAARPLVAQKYGVDPGLMTDTEADALGKKVDSMLPEDKAAYLKNLYAAAGPDGLQSISRQLKDKHDSLAIAGMLTSYAEPTVTHWFGADTGGKNVAEVYLQGKAALAENRVKVDNEKETGTKASIFSAIQGVYQTPQGKEAAAEAAYGIWAKYKADGTDDVEKAVNLATGGIMEHNGAKIAKPYGMPDSTFTDLITKTVPAQVKNAGGQFIANGHLLTADQFSQMLPGAKLRTFGQNSYLVMSGSDVVRNADGTAYMLKVQ